MTLENKLKQNNLSWRQKAVIGAAIALLPVTSLLGFGKSARANESNKLPADFLNSTQSAEVYESNTLSADFNRDGIVDAEDLKAFGDAWLAATEGQTNRIIPVYECGCLDQAGATYVLMKDINNVEGDCFTAKTGDFVFNFNESEV